ncbi:MAG: rhodanese-like domain-containing protein [Myxococcales bacterium]|nr:rhodanese-like domain-containing protein [Myxococcales bacterium]
MRFASIATLVLALALPAVGCDKDPGTPPGATAPGTPTGAVDDATAAKQFIAGGATVIDVREQDEWDEGHMPTAKLYPVGSIDQHVDEIAQLAGGKDKPVVVYCKSGGRASKAKQVLEAAGFTRVINGGGFRKLASP